MDNGVKILRKHTKEVRVGNVFIGGKHRISVQSMTNTDTRDVQATIQQINRLEEAGCDIARVAVPDAEAADAIKNIKKSIHIPIVADIHFDYRIAIRSIENGADKIRINPGNIGDTDNVKRVAQLAKSRGIPIRIGINSGSLDRSILEKYNGVTAEGMVESAQKHIKILENLGFQDIVVSLKASSVPMMMSACRLFADKFDYPQHLGVTEAGTIKAGTVKSAVGIGGLLAEGIGDTIRVSLTGDPIEEIAAGIYILKSLCLREQGINFISCPTCGRCMVDLIPIATEIENRVVKMDKNITVAVMGCAVNGPGEAREADIGIAGGKKEFILFKKGEIIRKIPQEKVIDELLHEIQTL